MLTIDSSKFIKDSFYYYLNLGEENLTRGMITGIKI